MVDITFVIGWVSNFILLFTLPIYVLFLLTLIKYRKDKDLSHAFFRLLLGNGLADILQIIMVLLGYNLAATGLVPELFIWMGDLFVKIYFPVSRGVYTAQCVGALWIAVNRLTALHFPFSYDRLQEKQWTRKEMAALKMTAAGFFICCGLISSVIFSKSFLNDVVGALGLTLFISSTPYVMFIFSVVRNRMMMAPVTYNSTPPHPPVSAHSTAVNLPD
uniref:Uncharacterized protein n=1 Tax=Plectus sambesii TaxID=2011161 RepID=A0A914X9X0_9BILA